ncbi:UNVERIFIED_CONTAM: hypothetical protein Slati_2741600 [Sesamum latifolium]|uniref:DUF4283 domain-containing protein n=1 Tax=Sesamum latifolium TaxID=2727402 RepID=A0AAW2VY87_9LAMI
MRESSPSSSSTPPLAIKVHEPLAVLETLPPRVLTPLMHLPSTAPLFVENPAASTPPSSHPPTAPTAEFFFGKVPLHNLIPVEPLSDQIASSFHNSTRKVLKGGNDRGHRRRSLVVSRTPIVLQHWQPGMALRKLKHTEVPVWIKLKHLPVEYWTEEGLSVVASGIGKPLYPDAITKACTRLDFARVCVMLNISSKLPKHIVILAPLQRGGGSLQS